MTKARGRVQQRERLLPAISALPEAESPHWSPDPERVEEHSVEVPLPGMGRIIGRQGLDIDSGRLVEFSISAQVRYDGVWSEVARVDTAHEEVHLHVRDRNGLYIARYVLFPVTGLHDVDRGYTAGEPLLISDWEKHERMWRLGLPGPGAGRGCA